MILDLDPVRGHEQAGVRRALVVSYEPFHRSGNMTICPITASRSNPRYPGDVALPVGEAGQTKSGVIVCSQVRTVSTARVRTDEVLPGKGVQYLTDPAIRGAVRAALAHQLGLDVPARADGAAVR